MIEHSPSITKLMAALLAVQGKVDGVQKDSKNPHFKNKYASLEAVVDTIRDPCQSAGLVVMQAPGEYSGGAISITTMIAHAESGEWIRSTLQLPVGQKQDPQGAGSAITYGLRYSLMALLNLPPVDDDGESARERPAQQYEQRTPLREQLVESVAIERAKEPASTHAPAYAADVERIRNACEMMKGAPQYYAFVERTDFMATYENLPKVGKAAADAILAGARKRLGIKGELVSA